MEIYLNSDYNNEKEAKIFAEKIKEVTLKEIASQMNLDFSNKRIEILINPEGLKQTHTSVAKIVEKLNEKGFEYYQIGKSK